MKKLKTFIFGICSIGREPRGGVGERGNTRRHRSRDRSNSRGRRSRSPNSRKRRSRSRSPKKVRGPRRRKCSLYWDVPPPGKFQLTQMELHICNVLFECVSHFWFSHLHRFRTCHPTAVQIDAGCWSNPGKYRS